MPHLVLHFKAAIAQAPPRSEHVGAGRRNRVPVLDEHPLGRIVPASRHELPTDIPRRLRELIEPLQLVPGVRLSETAANAGGCLLGANHRVPPTLPQPPDSRYGLELFAWHGKHGTAKRS